MYIISVFQLSQALPVAQGYMHPINLHGLAERRLLRQNQVDTQHLETKMNRMYCPKLYEGLDGGIKYHLGKF